MTAAKHGPDDDCPECYECPGCGGGDGSEPVNPYLDFTTHPNYDPEMTA